MIGKVVSHYRILEKLGEGGMGVVYKAEDLKLTRTVALKFLPHGADTHELEQTRFQQEARAAAILNHPNICTIHDIVTEEDRQFIVMEFVDGVTLRERIPVRKIQDAVAYALQIAEALQEAHSHGVVHRDIKADNIMVNAKNQVKVMDFGLARFKGSLKLTRTTSTIGTIAYMAPEQIQGGEADARSDIFSFGVLLYEILTGSLPFRGEHEAAVVYSIVNEPPVPIQTLLPNIPTQIVHIIDRALEKNPEDRYQTVQEMAIELRRAKRDTAGVSRKVSPPLAETAPLGEQEGKQTPLPTEAPGTRVEKPAGWRKWPLIAGSALGIALLATIVFQYFGGTPPEYGFRSLSINRLTAEGNAFNPAISPDGKYVAYVTFEKDQRTLCLRHIASGSTTPLLVRKNARISTTAFSPDGNYLYFSIAEGGTGSFVVFQIPVIGGALRKVKEGTSVFALSPDGKRIAFCYRNHREKRDELKTVNCDGTDERTISTFAHPAYFLGPLSWSPDGSKIAGVYGNPEESQESAFFRAVGVVSIADGGIRVLSPGLWLLVGGIAWLPAGNGLIVTAAERIYWSNALWQVSHPDGVPRRITSDLTNYSSISLTGDGATLVAGQEEMLSSIWILPDLDSKRARQVTPGLRSFDGMLGLAVTQDRKILYTSSSSGGQNVWSVDQDGANRRQITFDSVNYEDISISHDGKYLVAARSRGGVFRMDLDGSNLRQVLGGACWSPSHSLVGPWFVYTSFDSSGFTLWKSYPDSGRPVFLHAGSLANGVLSPDGTLIACLDFGTKPGIVVIPSDGGRSIKRFEVPASVWYIRWTPDGRGIAYVDAKGDIGNILVQPLAGGPPRQLTHFASDYIHAFAWSRDGKLLACARGKVTTDIDLSPILRTVS